MISGFEALCPTARILLSTLESGPSALGLTKAGLPRQRRPKGFRRTPEEIHLAGVRKANARYRRKFVLEGYTTHGTERIHRVWRTLDKMGLQGKAREAMRRRLIREENKQAGLTTRGTIRKNQVWPSELHDLSARERNRILTNDWLFRNRYAKGLTAKGTVPQSRRQTALEIAWQNFRSGGCEADVRLVSAAI